MDFNKLKIGYIDYHNNKGLENFNNSDIPYGHKYNNFSYVGIDKKIKMLLLNTLIFQIMNQTINGNILINDVFSFASKFLNNYNNNMRSIYTMLECNNSCSNNKYEENLNIVINEIKIDKLIKFNDCTPYVKI